MPDGPGLDNNPASMLEGASIKRHKGHGSVRLAFVAIVAGGAVAAAVALRRSGRDVDTRARTQRRLVLCRLVLRRGASLVGVKAAGIGKSEAVRAELADQYAIRSAEDVAEVLGSMKGAVMKLGQMVSFIAEGLPPAARDALATLQADVSPMAPELVVGVLAQELGAPPEALFRNWDPVPVAAASIGQVHRAVLHDGRRVAVKVQYPGVDRSIAADLDNAELLYGLFAGFALKHLDVRGLVDELRDRMSEELDYTIEAHNQAAFAARYEGHPFVRVPRIVPELSTSHVLTSEWADGRRWDELLADSTADERQRAAEVMARFALACIFRHGVFNGDPHPGNYRFNPDGSVTFLDFGLVKRWSPGEFDPLGPVLDCVLAADAPATVEAAIEAGFLVAEHGLDAQTVYDFMRGPYEPFAADHFTYSAAWVAGALQSVLDVQGAHADVLARFDMPRSYVILDRVVWGLSALLGRLEASNTWGAILAEYRNGADPATKLGRLEADWQATRGDSVLGTAASGASCGIQAAADDHKQPRGHEIGDSPPDPTL